MIDYKVPNDSLILERYSPYLCATR